MKLPVICSLALSTILICGCQETEQQAVIASDAYPNINLPVEEIARRIINHETGVGANTVWLCYEPPTGDVITPTLITFQSDGSGTFQPFGTADPMIWSLLDDVLTMETAKESRTYHQLTMPVSTVINATILPLYATDTRTRRDAAISDGTGPFSCVAGYANNNFDVLVPVGPDVFANGSSVSTASSQWSCKPLPGNNNFTQLQMTLELALTLGADGAGDIAIGERPEQPVSLWQLSDRTMNITVSDGTNVDISLIRHNGENFIADTVLDGVSAGKKDCSLIR